ncbi:YeeE/YedE family protein [Pseudomonas sp. CDFA 610]|uniref:YeeE/YedE family protein n=1 Tax=Pseudomonas sp. CDFA 610 TaxID=2829825 RepID=UPI001E3A5656|nr:YeeE/YedE family protein [Pseudomonas sp. CDFA 610]MCD5983350.1 YeeE/YedE family protein [Pseudomonas sp. CDFA 610]
MISLSSHFTPWTSLAGGVLIGLAASLFILFNGRIAGISGLLGSVLSGAGEGRGEKLLFLTGLLASPLIWSMGARLPEASFTTEVFTLLVAGLMVGIGTRYGAGCTSGHGVCGLSRLSPRSIVAVCCFMGSSFACVYLIRHVAGV